MSAWQQGLRWLRRHPLSTTALAFVLAVSVVVLIGGLWGFSAFADSFRHLHPGWIGLAAGASLITFPTYVLAYRAIAHVADGPRLNLRLVVRLVSAGFGPFAPTGGFTLDKRALHAIADDEHEAITRVLGLGALEWALLAPAAWLSAVVLLASGDHRPLGSLLWPWALAVPAGFAIGLWLAAPARRERIAGPEGRERGMMGRALYSISMLYTLAADIRTCWVAWLGLGLYWVADIAAFYGAVAFIGLHINLGELVLAYATGYALTRRSTPMGGAGTTEALMTFALHWVGQPVPAALAAVVVYRVFNFVLPTVPALVVRPAVGPLLEAAERGHTPAEEERRHAARRFRIPSVRPGRVRS